MAEGIEIESSSEHSLFTERMRQEYWTACTKHSSSASGSNMQILKTSVIGMTTTSHYFS